MFSPLYLKIFEKSPFLMKTPIQNFAHHTEVKKHPFGVKTPNLATLSRLNSLLSLNYLSNAFLLLLAKGSTQFFPSRIPASALYMGISRAYRHLFESAVRKCSKQEFKSRRKEKQAQKKKIQDIYLVKNRNYSKMNNRICLALGSTLMLVPQNFRSLTKYTRAWQSVFEAARRNFHGFLSNVTFFDTIPQSVGKFPVQKKLFCNWWGQLKKLPKRPAGPLMHSAPKFGR